ncbi:ABC transporter ATP-binding protein [Williamsia sp.]|uniref:ABC transporter ATP-binding protein n=1 Tax=Williamsia sp. TaxID=1872085 RepID=UPI002F947D01
MTENSPLLEGSGLHLGYRGRTVVDDLDVHIEPGTATALVGPNGSGKSTLLMALARVLAPRSGEVRLDGRPISTFKSIEVARRLAILPQTSIVPPGLRVRELVEQGRYPRLGPLAMLSRRDDEVMQRAMDMAGVASMADRRLDSLSGGERQRAWIAMALAQDTGTLLLDEPTTYLDIRHQIDLMELTVDLVRAHRKTVVMVLHDINQAARYCDRIIAMRDGKILADGHPNEVVDADLLSTVFDVRARISRDPVSGRPMFTAQ